MGNRRAQSCAPAKELWWAGKLPKKSGENFEQPRAVCLGFLWFFDKVPGTEVQVKAKIKVKVEAKVKAKVESARHRRKK